MTGVEIDRLTLQVPSVPADQGYRLAEMVAAGLAQARWAPTRSGGNVSVAVPASAAAGSLEQLAGLIVDALRRQMAEGS